MANQQILQTAIAHHQAGRLAEAQNLYEKILVKDPRNADALHLLGTLLAQTGKLEEGLEFIRRAVAAYPRVAVFRNSLGETCRRMGKLDEAIAEFGVAIELDPRLVEAHLNLSAALTEASRFEEAIAPAEKGIDLRPNFAPAHFNLARALEGADQDERAVAAYRRALELQPNYADAQTNLGSTLQKMGEFDEAISASSRAIQLSPDSARAFNNLGVSLEARSRLDEAMAAYTKALQLNPNEPRAHNNMGHLLANQGRYDEAIAACSQAIRLQPDFADAHRNLAYALTERGLLDEALQSCTRVLSFDADSAQGHNTMGNILKDARQIQPAMACYRRAMELDPDNSAVYSNLLYTMYFDPECGPAQILAEHRLWAARHAAALAPKIPTEKTTADNRRLRIGYVSPDFRAHPIGRFMLPLLARHNHQEFEIFCYASIHLPDSFTPRIQQHADVWRDIRSLSDEEAAEQIRTDRIDILVDLTMHMARNRMLLFARKPAPVQVTYLAYAGTTGLEAIDYRITDPHLDPPGGTDEYYTEKSIRLPQTYWCYEPPIENLPKSPLPAASAGFVTFGCLNNFCKITDEALRTWCAIMAGTPNSRLLLHAAAGSHRDRVRQTLREHAIDPERLSFVEKLSLPEYMEQYRRIDIALDPFPYVGGTTTCDALWMGVPVVTVRGQTAISRGGASILTNIGIPELIGSTLDEYIQIAVALANDPARLGELRQTLRDRMRSSPLMDAPNFARNMEEAFRRMASGLANLSS